MCVSAPYSCVFFTFCVGALQNPSSTVCQEMACTEDIIAVINTSVVLVYSGQCSLRYVLPLRGLELFYLHPFSFTFLLPNKLSECGKGKSE